jgi:hypothetical protein
MFDYDLAGSSFPPIPQRREPDARGALLLAARSLERADPVEVLGVLGGLRAGLPVAEVLTALEGLAKGSKPAAW